MSQGPPSFCTVTFTSELIASLSCHYIAASKRKKTKHRTNTVTAIQKVTGYRLVMYESIPLSDMRQRTKSKRFDGKKLQKEADYGGCRAPTSFSPWV